MELKNTLLMPKTQFEMRGNLARKEPVMVQKWQDENLYFLMNKRREHAPTFVLHDGPPYANGNIHCGHMLNRILKDFIVRYKNMAGFYTPFTFGWDTHGLPIENKVTASGVDRKLTPISTFRELCGKYAKEQVAIQKEQIRRLGCLGDYDKPYLTLDKAYEADQLRVFKKMALDGLIYKGKKPVYWSPSSESALAEAEIEYQDVSSPSIYVAFKVADTRKHPFPADTAFVIWTTTPWTLPANLAIAVHPDFTYGLYQTPLGHLILLPDLVETVMQDLHVTAYQLVSTFKGQTLENLEAKHPFYARTSRILLGTHVTAESGTGLVHTAPGHGEDDFIIGQKYGLDVLCPVDEHGIMTKEAGPRLAGLTYEEANDEVLKILREKGLLLAEKTLVHSYPHDWRTHLPVIFRATPQWFCSIEKIKAQLLKNVDDVTWIPSWGKKRMENMIKDRYDWCISRQRVWGVPIPIIYTEDQTPIIEAEVFDHIIGLVEQYGSNIWFEKAAKDLLPKGYTHPLSPNGKFTKEKDIMDVWFDSGSSALHVIKNAGLPFPSDLYLEGNDQYRGWFNSSLVISSAITGLPPYKAVLSHGFVLDENWAKMSKSQGNGIDPLKIANAYGSDILRLWAASIDYQSDVRISEAIIAQTAETYRKIRNTLKFILGNLAVTPETVFTLQDVTYSLFDRFVLNQLQVVTDQALAAYENYAFNTVLSLVTNFIVTDLSALYLDYAKDILYCESAKSQVRIGVIHTLNRIFDTLIRLLNPILCFTCEEAYRALNRQDLLTSPQLLDMVQTGPVDEKLTELYQSFLLLRDQVYKALEEARQQGLIGSSLEAEVHIKVGDEALHQVLTSLTATELARLFIVSKATLTTSEDLTIKKATGSKCDRCWNYKDDVTVYEDFNLCARCAQVIHEDYQ
ncbi:MAG: isoleucine--tRNA ligase [Bacilli bacterium]|jgi:isoleucyl-tRNA synthetase